MFLFFYNLLIWLVTITLFPVLLVQQRIKGKPVLRYLLGFSRKELKKVSGRKVLWIQAASVGETKVAARLLQEIKPSFTGYAIVFTGNTSTGQATAQQEIKDYTDLIGYFPFDHPWLVRRFLNRLQPEILILVETEIWPNILSESKKRGVKIMIVNGRLDKSYRRLQKSGFYKSALGLIDYFAVQSETDRERFINLGAPPEKVEITGNIKFDFDYPTIPEDQRKLFIKELSLTDSAPILTAASTHGGEEKIIISAFKIIKKELPEAFLILAPRHIDRADEIVKLLLEHDLKYARRTDLTKGEKLRSKPDLLLLDTFGELGLAYSLASLAFIGGSLVPVGGHNLLEASFQEKIVCYGPYMHNFRESKELLEREGVGFTVVDENELAERFLYFYKNQELKDSLGKKTKQIIIANQGATEKTVRKLKEILKNK